MNTCKPRLSADLQEKQKFFGDCSSKQAWVGQPLFLLSYKMLYPPINGLVQ